MPHRAHLFSLRVGHALREVLGEGYRRGDLAKARSAAGSPLELSFSTLDEAIGDVLKTGKDHETG